MTSKLSTDQFGRTVIESDNIAVTLMPMKEFRDRNKKARIYIWDAPEPAGLEMPAFTAKGEDPANDAAWRAFNRAELAIRKPIVAEALALVGQWVDTNATGARAFFSRKAGCGCGCSPGFVVDAVLRPQPGRSSYPFELSVHVKKPVVTADLVDAFSC